MTVTVLRGVLGWGNRKSGLEAYGPGGRWGEGREGDLLGDALERAGAHEGADLLVIAVDRFGDLSAIANVMALFTDATDETKNRLAQLLDDEGYGAWVDTAQLVDTLREHSDVVLAALTVVSGRDDASVQGRSGGFA